MSAYWVIFCVEGKFCSHRLQEDNVTSFLGVIGVRDKLRFVSRFLEMDWVGFD